MRGNYTENICLNVRNTKGKEILSEVVHETIVCDMNIFGALGIAPIYTKNSFKSFGQKVIFSKLMVGTMCFESKIFRSQVIVYSWFIISSCIIYLFLLVRTIYLGNATSIEQS